MGAPRLPLALLGLLWSGPQGPFLERYLRPEETHAENPRTVPRRDAAMIVLILAAVAVVLALVLAFLTSFLMSGVP